MIEPHTSSHLFSLIGHLLPAALHFLLSTSITEVLLTLPLTVPSLA
jgi:RsiW-degrading membrane proteinase PrsW (M82 family)